MNKTVSVGKSEKPLFSPGIFLVIAIISKQLKLEKFPHVALTRSARPQ